jgi:hypothetical protein
MAAATGALPPPARLVSLLAFGCDAPALAQQQLLGVANEATTALVDTSVRGGCSNWPSTTHVNSGEFLHQLAAMFEALSPPVTADLCIESQMVHIVRRTTDGGAFSLCCPISQMTPEQRSALDDVLENPDDYFDKVVRVKTDFMLPYGEKPPPKCSRCRFNADISVVLGRADLLPRAAASVRALVATADPEHSWQTFQCLMDQLAQMPLFAHKPSFGEFYYSYVSGWNELRARNALAKTCWKLVSRSRLAHFTGHGQRAVAADFFRVSKARCSHVASPAHIAPDPEDEAAVTGFCIAGSFFKDAMKSATPEMETTAGFKCVYMGLEVLARGSGRDTLERLYAQKKLLGDVAARALMPYAWPPGLADGPAPEVTHTDVALLRRATRAMCGFMFVASELRGDAPSSLDLGMAHWYAVWKAGCAGQQLPAAREACKRFFAPVIAHIYALGNVPAAPDVKERLNAAARSVVNHAVAYERRPQHSARPFAVRARPWCRGSLDHLGETVASKTHFFEINSLFNAMQKREPDAVVVRLEDQHPGTVLSAEHTAATGWGGEEERPFAHAFLIEDAVLMSGSLRRLERRAVLDVVAFGMVSAHMADILYWALRNADAKCAARVVAARYGLEARDDVPATAGEEAAAGFPGNAGDRAALGRAVELLTGAGPSGRPAEELERFETGPAVAFACDDGEGGGDPGALRAFALWVLQLDECAAPRVSALDALPLYLRPHPLAGLCDGTADQSAHPLWSVRPDLLRVLWMSMHK